MNVHNNLGRGFKEIVYKDALEVELLKEQVVFEREKPFKIIYNVIVLPHKFIADFFLIQSY